MCTNKDIWELHVDDSSNRKQSSVGIVLTSLEENPFDYALRFDFKASNNTDEYEALIKGI